jgi:hypothetical protein
VNVPAARALGQTTETSALKEDIRTRRKSAGDDRRQQLVQGMTDSIVEALDAGDFS